MRLKYFAFIITVSVCLISFYSFLPKPVWESKFIKLKKDGSLNYIPDEKGNIIPDFSRIGYAYGDRTIPVVSVVKSISPSSNSTADIQAAIDELSGKTPGPDGFRGAIVLRKGTYQLSSTLRIETGGIVLRGEGRETKLIAGWKTQDPLIRVEGKGRIQEIPHTRNRIMEEYVPVGAVSFTVTSAAGYKKGDRIIVFRPGTRQWITDLKMDRIEERNGTKQWQPSEYNLQFERTITRIEGNRIFIDNPVVMALESKYGGGEIYKYSFDGRISNVGVEDLYCESVFEKDTSENHAWDAIHFDKIEQGWIQHVEARHFAYSCVNLGSGARNITVLNCECYDHKSVITGGRRYSFNNNGQLNLFMNCRASDGRHDFVTGARVCGPNAFVNCSATKTHADIGPHHRWSSGTLYDNIITDGEINIQDRGNYGSGHGWVGITQVLWNCTARKATVQSPWVNGKNYCIGLKGEKSPGRFKDRPDGEWEGQNKDGLKPASLYQAQLVQRKKKLL